MRGKMAAVCRWLLIGLLTSLVLGLGLQPERPDYVGLIQKGDGHAAAKEYSFAASAYRRAATLRPGSPLPLLRLGSTFLAQAWLDRAQEALLAAHRQGGWTPELHQQMGRLYLGLGLPAEAVAQWEAALAADPGLAEARLGLGWAYLGREAWDDARAAFEAVLGRWDDAHRERWQPAHYGLGLLLALEDPVAALHHLQIAAAGVDRAMAEGAMAMGAALERATPLADPAHAAVILGQGYVRVEAWPLARRALAQALTAEPGYVEAMAYLGHALDYPGRAPEAERHLRRAVQLAPTETLPRYLLGLYYRRREKPRQAAFQFRQALKLDPRDAALYAELGGAWLDEQNYLDAENAFRAAAELAPEQAGFRLLLAHFYVDHLIKVRSRGLPAAQGAAQLNPDDAEAFDVLGWAYYLVGSLDEAERALSRAVALDPESASARYHLAVVQRQRGQLAEATYQFWRAIDLDRTGHYRSQAMRALDLPVE
ncbi:MAG: tetratricopeptide repeat protein [Anaerolineae bacterium]|nr:MAG: tetratricopeptide repeat protein [Anaerolineae bacterium]